jgi:nitrate/nitrite transport system ATP-binding protein
MAFLKLQGASKSFGTRNVLENVNLFLDEGEFVSVVGASAAGKSTLLRIASGLLKPDAGGVFLRGLPIGDFPRGASIVFQNYSLLPWLSALENVRLAVEGAFPEWTKSQCREQAGKYLRMVGLGAALAKRPSQLSGGMRQRVAIARAFAVEPRILFLDEPFGALDALTRATLQQELARLCQEREPKATVLLITNSVDEAILLSDRIVALSRGPGASLSPAVTVSLARPRPTGMLMHDQEAVSVRAQISEFLVANAPHARRRELSGAVAGGPAWEART